MALRLAWEVYGMMRRRQDSFIGLYVVCRVRMCTMCVGLLLGYDAFITDEVKCLTSDSIS